MVDGLRLHISHNNDSRRIQTDDCRHAARWPSQGKRRVFTLVAGPDARREGVVRRRTMDAPQLHGEAAI